MFIFVSGYFFHWLIVWLVGWLIDKRWKIGVGFGIGAHVVSGYDDNDHVDLIVPFDIRVKCTAKMILFYDTVLTRSVTVIALRPLAVFSLLTKHVIEIITLSAVATDCFVFVGVFFSVSTITHEPPYWAWWNFAWTCILTTARTLLNFKVKVTGPYFWIFYHCEIGQRSLLVR